MSNSKLSVKGTEEMTFLGEKFMKILECPICFEIPLVAPIHQCISGHSFCAQCRPKVSQCGLCTKKFSRSRNYVAEALIEAATFKCKYESQGCTEVSSGPLMNEHQKMCYFRPVLCSDHRKAPCFENPVDVNNFIRHLRTQHRCSGFDTELEAYEKWERSSLNKASAWVFFFIKYDGKYFIKHTQTDEENIYWWLSLIGTPEEARKYYATITVFSSSTVATPKVMLTKVEFTVPVHCFRDSFETVSTGVVGGCGILPKSHLRRFCLLIPRGPTVKTQRYEWKMQFKIMKMEVAEPEVSMTSSTSTGPNGNDTDESNGI